MGDSDSYASHLYPQKRKRPFSYITPSSPYDNEDEDAFSPSNEKVEEYHVESVLSRRWLNGKRQYLLKWKGYPATEASWEPEENCHCHDLIKEYESNNAGSSVVDPIVPTPRKRGRPRKNPLPTTPISNGQINYSITSSHSNGVNHIHSGASSTISKASNTRPLDYIEKVFSEGGKLYFSVKWGDKSSMTSELASHMNLSHPTDVIAFYESLIMWESHENDF